MVVKEIEIVMNFLSGYCTEDTVMLVALIGIVFHINLKCAIIRNSYILYNLFKE